jgi:hypothetical protein
MFNKRLFLVISIFITLIISFQTKVYATSDVLTCTYDVNTITYGSLNFSIIINDDDTLVLPYRDDEIVNDVVFGYANNFKKDYLAAAKTTATKYKCPDLSLLVKSTINLFVGYKDAIVNEDNYINATLTSEKFSNEENEIKITHECEYNLENYDDLKTDVTLKLMMNQLGEKFFSINGIKSKVQKNGYQIYYNGMGYFLNPTEEASFFKQTNFQMANNNLFVCPNKVYTYQEDATRYTLTLIEPKNTANTKLDVTSINGKKLKDSEAIDQITGEPIDCSTFIYTDEKTKETENLISDIFNIIMIAAPILVIVLGSLDFAKASLAQDENALKKAGTNFGKRLIAAALLFLLPLIINIILGLAFDAGVFEDNEVPEVCLEQK